MTWRVFSMGHRISLKTKSFRRRQIIHESPPLKKNMMTLKCLSVLHKGLSKRHCIIEKGFPQTKISSFRQRIAKWSWHQIATLVEQVDNCRTYAPPIQPTAGHSEGNFCQSLLGFFHTTCYPPQPCGRHRAIMSYSWVQFFTHKSCIGGSDITKHKWLVW